MKPDIQRKSPGDGKYPGREQKALKKEYNTTKEVESTIVGASLSGMIEEIADIITPDMIPDGKLKKYFRAALELYREGYNPDPPSVMLKLREQNKWNDGIDGFTYLDSLRDYAPPGINLKYFIDKLLKHHKNQTIKKVVEFAYEKVENGDFDGIENVINDARKSFYDTSQNTLKPIPATELPETATLQDLWAGWLYPESITMISAAPGIGKTTLFYNIALSGCEGKDYLDMPFSKELKILFVDVETPLGLKGIKLKRICGDEPRPENLQFLSELNIHEDFNKLLKLIKAEGFDIVIFDTMSAILGMKDENDNSEANRLLKKLRKLVNETGICLVLIHHIGKSENSKGVYRGRGASAIAGGVDVVINIESLEHDLIKITTDKNKWGEANPPLYLMKKGDDQFEKHTPPDNKSGFEIHEAQKYLNSLSDTEEYKTEHLHNLCNEKGFSESTVKRAITKLLESGKWERIRKGLYRKRSKGQKDHTIYNELSDPNSQNPCKQRGNDGSSNGSSPDDLTVDRNSEDDLFDAYKDKTPGVFN